MRNVVLFGEDYGHEAFLGALVTRLADESHIEMELASRSVRGGHGKAIAEFEQYAADVVKGVERLPDLIVVATDANCVGLNRRLADMDTAIPGRLKPFVVCAIPDPHIERWLLLDSHAFKQVLGQGCQAPAYKCQRDRYKRLLRESVSQTGVSPQLGGLEYAADLVAAMDLQAASKADASLKRAVSEIEGVFKNWVCA